MNDFKQAMIDDVEKLKRIKENEEELEKGWRKLNFILTERYDGNGWWKESTRDTYHDTYYKIARLSNPSFATSLLVELYYATAEEFGE